jgi:3-oxoadipate enol-lactonase
MVNGVEIAWELCGRGEDAIAFLNGIAMSMGSWKPIAQDFEASSRCLLHDMRGQLLSGKPEGKYSLELHAEDLAALLNSLGLRRAHIIGTSYGAEVGIAFALAHPEMTRSLALIDGVSETDPLLEATVRSWIETAKASPFAFYRTILPWNYSSAYIAAHGEELARREAVVASFPKEWFEAFIRLCEAFLEIDLSPRLGEISCPCLVMVGENDILKGEGFARILAEGIRGARLEAIPGAGHAAVIEAPEFIAKRLKAFYESI